MATINNNAFWKDFFELFKSLPALWKVKSNEFKNKEEKTKSWNILLNKFKEVEPSANIDFLKKKINNIKACYRRELKKVEKSFRSGAGAEEEYIPTLWYFEELDFLRDQEAQIHGASSMEFDEVDFVEQGIEASQQLQKRKKTINQHLSEKNSLLREALGLMQQNKKDNEENTKDDASIFAESWAASFRSLEGPQKIFAKKAIEEILILGQLKQLTLQSVQAPSASTSRTSTPIVQYPLSLSSSPLENNFIRHPNMSNVIVQPREKTYHSLEELVNDSSVWT